MANMIYPVRVKLVSPDPAERPTLVDEFKVSASNVDAARRLVTEKIKKSGRDIRSLSFSPDPEPTGGVVYVVSARK